MLVITNCSYAATSSPTPPLPSSPPPPPPPLPTPSPSLLPLPPILSSVPPLDLSRLSNAEDALMAPLELLPSGAGKGESLSTLSWGFVDVRAFSRSKGTTKEEGAGPEEEEEPASSGRVSVHCITRVGSRHGWGGADGWCLSCPMWS